MQTAAAFLQGLFCVEADDNLILGMGTSLRRNGATTMATSETGFAWNFAA